MRGREVDRESLPLRKWRSFALSSHLISSVLPVLSFPFVSCLLVLRIVIDNRHTRLTPTPTLYTSKQDAQPSPLFPLGSACAIRHSSNSNPFSSLSPFFKFKLKLKLELGRSKNRWSPNSHSHSLFIFFWFWPVLLFFLFNLFDIDIEKNGN